MLSERERPLCEEKKESQQVRGREKGGGKREGTTHRENTEKTNQVPFWGLCIIPYLYSVWYMVYGIFYFVYFVLLITFAGPISDTCSL